MGKDLKGKELGKGLSQRKDGVYSGRYVDRFGNRKTIYKNNLTELKKLLKKAIYEDSCHMNVVDESITLDEWYKKWLDIHKYNTIRPNTRRYYNQIYTQHISPSLGKLRLKDITQLKIKALLNKLDKEGLGFQTQNKVRVLLQDMFDKAMIDDFAIKNPAKGIKVKSAKKKDVRVLSVEEQAEFFECAAGTFYNNLFTVAVSTGLRPGELCALTWDDIDLDNMVIKVTKTLVYQKFEGDNKKVFHLGPPKTESSVRDVPINRQCELALKKQLLLKAVTRSKYPDKVIPEFEDLLFTTSYGTPINASIYSDAIKSIVNEINLCRDPLEQFETFSGHCFRHTFATRCFEAEIQPKTVQGFLGHATLQMTMDLYTHVMEDHKKEEMSKLEERLDSFLRVKDENIESKFGQFCKNGLEMVQ